VPDTAPAFTAGVKRATARYDFAPGGTAREEEPERDARPARPKPPAPTEDVSAFAQRLRSYIDRVAPRG
jgi:hypothetical protein